MSAPVLTWAERSRKLESAIDEIINKSIGELGAIPTKEDALTLGYLTETANNMRYFREIAIERNKVNGIASALESLALQDGLSPAVVEGLRQSAQTLYEIDI